MLDDRRVNVRAVFTEHRLFECEHFFDLDSKKYHRQNEEEGYLLERMTIAHYAVIIEDFKMVDDVLNIAPDLLQATCCFTKGKNLLSKSVISVATLKKRIAGKVVPDYERGSNDHKFNKYLDKVQRLDDEVAGELALVTIDTKKEKFSAVTRIVNVTFLHLAARLGNELIYRYLRGKQVNSAALDSDQQTPFNHLQLSISEGFFKETKATKQLYKILKPIARLNRPYLPETCCVLHREGYDMVYDTRTKVPVYTYERLTKTFFARRDQA